MTKHNTTSSKQPKSSETTNNNQKKNTSASEHGKKPYNPEKHLKLSNRSPQRTEKIEKYEQLKKEIQEIQEDLDSAAKPTFNHQDRYVQDLIMFAAFASFLQNKSEEYKERNKDALETQQQALEQKIAAGENFEQNMETYKQFKEQHKIIRVHEEKLNDFSLDEKENKSLHAKIQNAQKSLDELSAKFDIYSTDTDTQLTFANNEEALSFFSKMEERDNSSSYRQIISNPEEIKAIADASIDNLETIAIKTVNVPSVTDLSADRYIVNESLL